MVAETTGSLAASGAAKTNIHSREYRRLHMVAAHLHEQVYLPRNINLFSFYLCELSGQRRDESAKDIGTSATKRPYPQGICIRIVTIKPVTRLRCRFYSQ